MVGIKHYVLDENEEVPYEFVVTKNVNEELRFCAAFVNTNTLDYGNGALLKLHQRNDELRAENAKLCELVRMMWKPFCWAQSGYDVCLTDEQDKAIRDFVRELGIEVEG